MVASSLWIYLFWWGLNDFRYLTAKRGQVPQSTVMAISSPRGVSRDGHGNEREMHYALKTGTPALGYILDSIIVVRRAFIANVSM